MPYLKKRPAEFEDVVKLLKANDLGSGCRLARVLGTCDSTGLSRLNHPGDLTLRELGKICRNGHIPADEIRAAIKFT